MVDVDSCRRGQWRREAITMDTRPHVIARGSCMATATSTITVTRTPIATIFAILTIGIATATLKIISAIQAPWRDIMAVAAISARREKKV